MNNSGPVAQIIERAGWKTGMDFVGHRKAITVVVSSNCVNTLSSVHLGSANSSFVTGPDFVVLTETLN